MLVSLRAFAGRFLLAAVVFFVAGELLARGLGIVDRLNGYNRQLFVRGATPDIPYALRPGIETSWFGTAVRVNGDGLRGPAVRDGGRRILLLGDSVVFGQGVAEESTVAAELERALGGDVVVLNAGVPGYDSAAEAAVLAYLAPRLRPAEVVVGLSLNDFDTPPRLSPLGVLARSAPAGSGVASRSEFLLLLRWIVATARGRLEGGIEDGSAMTPDVARVLDQATEQLHRRIYADEHAPELARLRAGLTTLAATAARLGLPLLVAIFPESFQVGPGELDLVPQRRVLAICADVGVRCLDLQPAFAAGHGPLFVDVQHPNANGHAIAATAIAHAVRP